MDDPEDLGGEDAAHERRTLIVRLLFGVSALTGLIMIALSFANWVDFEPEPGALVEGPAFGFSLDGTELSRVRGPDYEQPADIVEQTEFPCSCRVGFGDGYMVMILGGAIIGASLAGMMVIARARAAAAAIVVASLIAFVIAGYNATGLWEGVGAQTLDDTFVNLDGDIRAELILLMVVSALPAVLGAAVWSILPRQENGSLDETVTAEDAEVWA
jgi:hypothetical protein